MKLKFFPVYFIFSLCFFIQSHCNLLTVVLMVKNEEHVMRPTLQPFVDAGVKHFLIFDTGSTDQTIAVTEDFFAQHGVTDGVILQEPFIDFATSRNRALDLAEEIFPESTFFLMLDAEWYLQNVEGLLDFCKTNEEEFYPAYLVRIFDGSLDFYTARLIRRGSKLRFAGVVHEVLDFFCSEKVPADIFFKREVTRMGQEKSKKRWERDYDLLLQEHERDPNNSRTIFYLAQTCECLGNLHEACKWYKVRASLWGWEEENFMALYRLGEIYQRLGNWEKALHNYLESFSRYPSRAEPLIRIAQYYWDHNSPALCYLFSRRAVEIPYPCSDVLFVQKDLYDFIRYDLLGRSAWYVGEYLLGKEAVEKALEVHPNLGYLQGNLECYDSRRCLL